MNPLSLVLFAMKIKIYMKTVENRITLLTQNGTVENNQTNDKKIISRKGS